MPEDRDKDPKNPSTKSFAWDIMSPSWKKVDTVLGGTEVMRAAGGEVLPQHAEEDNDTYGERRFMAVLFNMSELTLDTWIGKPLGETIVRSEDMPEEVEEILENVDLLGNDINVYAYNWFRDGVSKAFSHTLIEMPRINLGTDANPRTKDDDRQKRENEKAASGVGRKGMHRDDDS